MVDSAILRWREAGSTPAWCTNMKHTLARRVFKQHLGQANHFLVTILVALDCLDANSNHQAPGLHAVWSPKSVAHSVQRSRIFAMHSFLSSAVDALDVYFSLLNRKPDYLQDQDFSEALQACKRSVYNKATKFAEWVPDSKIEAAMVEALITWRNNVMHELADNTLTDKSREILREYSVEISENYRNLNPLKLIEKANNGADLTFKETTSLISAAHKFVEKTDNFILHKLNKPDFYFKALLNTLETNTRNHGFRTRLFDINSKRWNGFISNWASNTLHSPPLEEEELAAILKLIPGLKQDKN